MTLDLDWGKCPTDLDFLTTEGQRNVSFVCGLVMMHANIGKITESTINELMAWSLLLKQEVGALLHDENGGRGIEPEEWLARMNMTANVRTLPFATRKANFTRRWNDYSASLLKRARKEAEAS